jgi:bifunctional ADP-heptose synthase (sugar kinase/adenylyltransferase)
LCGLRCVDYVIVFDEPTAERLVQALEPDVYVKGGDYLSEEALPEARVVRGYGGDVVILPYIPGHSTSRILARILEESRTQQGG